MTSSENNQPRIVVSAMSSLIDRAIDIRVVGLQPQQEVEVRASRTTASMKPLSLGSYAKFRANNEGIVELNSQEPLSGTYSGIDGMGLFWSLEIKEVLEDSQKGNHTINPLSSQIVKLSLVIENSIIDEIEIKRLWHDEQIFRYSVREHGLVGTYFYNENTTMPRPGIIVFGGSEGGIYEYPAALLASHGFSVLALGYFGIEDLPKQLVNIPLEYIKTAIDWMNQRNEVARGWLGIHGTSRGAELALLSASLFPEIRATVALNGFSVAFSGIVPWTDEKTLPPAWLYQNEPIPYLSPRNPVAVALKCKEMWNERRGNPLGEWYSDLASDPEAVKKAEIRVEKSNGPLLIISGEEDDVDTVGLSQIAIKRLEEYQFAHQFEHLIYPGAGHSIGIPNLMIAFNQGNKKDNAFASKDSWAKTITFFQQSYDQIQ